MSPNLRAISSVLLFLPAACGWFFAQNATPAVPSKTAVPPVAQDAREIVRRSVETDHHDWELAQNYTAQMREVETQLDKNGGIKSQKAKTYDLTFYNNELYQRLIQIDDQPLNAKQQKKEDEKLDKFLERQRKESKSDRQKRLRKEKEEREKGRAFLRDVVNAYDFTLLGEEKVNGTDTYVIQAEPRKDFHPTQPHAGILSKIRGKLWIEKKEYHWVKVEAEAIDTISFGLFLVRIHSGAMLTFDQVKVNDEVWLLRRLDVKGSARLALFKNFNEEQEQVFSNYKKFETSSRIVPGVQQAPEQNGKPEPQRPAGGPPK